MSSFAGSPTALLMCLLGERLSCLGSSSEFAVQRILGRQHLRKE